MITVIYSTHKDESYNNSFNEHINKTIGVKHFQLLQYQNNNEFSLAQIYNRGIKESQYNIVVCLHNDVKLETGWGKKLISLFDNNPDYGIIGKAGSCYFPESGIYWEKLRETMVGQVYHFPPNEKKFLSRYSAKLPSLIPVVTLDGLFIAFHKNRIKHLFDEEIGKFHFYDHGFCVPNYLDGVKIGVTTSFEITHESIGVPNEEFFITKDLFVNKYSGKLPLDIRPESVFVPLPNNNPVKTSGKLAVIIPTKGKIELLTDCIQSFIDLVTGVSYEIFVADTGSSDEEKLQIKSLITEKSTQVKIHLIEYDYYNFAKINNDVVKNHCDGFDYLLFCNNDIKLLNNAPLNMLRILLSSTKVGTVGCRLHFGNNLVQHDGIFAIINAEKIFGVSHLGLNSYYNFTNSIRNVLGNTGAFLMIKKTTFNKCNGFNKAYISCFEDVELNMNCIVNGFENFCDSNSVAYHYESQTRNEDSEKMTKLASDYQNNLLPFVVKNYEVLKNQIIVIN